MQQTDKKSNNKNNTPLIEFENFSFTYPQMQTPALSDIDLSIRNGEFVTICGKSGCGKSTLLRCLKPILAPKGDICGHALFNGNELFSLSHKEQCRKIGFVLQSPEEQAVCDKVWHELAFGLESLGLPTAEIRERVAEMASFFGIASWFHKDVSTLSGGQKQLLNLASVMVMNPEILILDEPTSRLDPISARDFLQILSRLNLELGITVIIAEHRLDDAFSISDRVIVLDEGKIIASGSPSCVGKALKAGNNEMFFALPAPMRVYADTENGDSFPVTIREGRAWLSDYASSVCLSPIENTETYSYGDAVIELDEVWYRYGKDMPDIIRNMSFSLHSGEVCAIMGGNGAGKSTMLSLICGTLKCQRGRIKKRGGCSVALLPQNPQSLFLKKMVKEDLYEIFEGSALSASEIDDKVSRVVSLCRLSALLSRHPYDLSGGEQQRVALAKILLTEPSVLLLDEPTKGFDAHFKHIFAEILLSLKHSGVAIALVSHDIEFCAEYSDRCVMVFDGGIVCENTPRKFFKDKSFYTTSANRLARGIIDDVILPEDIISALGKEATSLPKREEALYTPQKAEPQVGKSRRFSPVRLALGAAFVILCAITVIFLHNSFTDNRAVLIQGIELLFAGLGLGFLLPRRKTTAEPVMATSDRLSKRSLLAAVFVLIAVPLTILAGVRLFGDRRYYLVSVLIMLETLIPFFVVFENRRPQARELVIISILCAISVFGRVAFYMIPQFKPSLAIIIITGIALGGESGFLVGAISGFVSNFFFGQGPWTPWQMFAYGIVGFVSGLLFKNGRIKHTRLSLCIFGAIATVLLYGGIMNPASVITFYPQVTSELIIASYAMGLPFDLLHAGATAFFLWFAGEPTIEKLDRLKLKYDIYA